MTPNNQLSPEVQDLLTRAPIAVDIPEVIVAERNYGTSFVLQRLQEVFDEQFPGWRTYYQERNYQYSASGWRPLQGILRSIRW